VTANCGLDAALRGAAHERCHLAATPLQRGADSNIRSDQRRPWSGGGRRTLKELIPENITRVRARVQEGVLAGTASTLPPGARHLRDQQSKTPG
jgi:hypothetical protein